ncbi:MAG TPA: NAD(P)-dependent oxidoreductase [Bryobacteraceae bacterium]|nr:NAD(P)-dependent oxidoreductase [Bryobacteraceae bacterium]HPT27189.1 NAD(P)-dependent oxidoreductase [Bryobacteraceae bacterium]
MTSQQLENRLSAPSPGDVEFARRLDGDVLVLGAAGKMGPSLAHRVRRAMDEAGTRYQLITVSRSPLAVPGTRHIQSDLLADGALDALPDAPNVLFLAARKFGSTGAPEQTWSTNVLLPALVARRYRNSRIVSFSTGNVYPLTPVASGGPTEETLVDPVGEYAWSALGRERMFTYGSAQFGTKVTLLRLNYANELRYGVLVDIAVKVRDGVPVDVSMGHANIVWQGYANSVCFRSLGLASAPPAILNLTGPEILSVRELAMEFGKRLGREPVITGEEQPTALLNNAAKCHGLFGKPDVSVEELMGWVAEWVGSGGELLGKPTKFQVRDGKF